MGMYEISSLENQAKHMYGLDSSTITIFIYLERKEKKNTSEEEGDGAFETKL